MVCNIKFWNATRWGAQDSEQIIAREPGALQRVGRGDISPLDGSCESLPQLNPYDSVCYSAHTFWYPRYNTKRIFLEVTANKKLLHVCGT